MKLLFTGRGTSGSWKIRGEQLADALGAKAKADCIDVEHFDMAVLVKRPSPGLVQRLQDSGIPFVWDIVDAYPQPVGNQWEREACMDWLTNAVQLMQPTALVAATKAMARDCESLGLPVLYLPHHARPGLYRNPIRPVVKKVGYEGGEQYLGRWRQVLERECRQRGWEFVVNPHTLSELDIVVAMREDKGYAPRYWKSNVKLANAQGSGTPFIGVSEAGYLETASGAEFFADTEYELMAACGALANREARQFVSNTLLAATPQLMQLARVYSLWLHQVKAGHDNSRSLQG